MHEIRLLAAEMEDGEHRYLDCPSCGRPKKFSITKLEGRAIYHCFRPACELYKGGATGPTGTNLVRTRLTEQKAAFTPYEGELERPSDDWIEYLRTQIGWTEEHFDIGRPMYAPEDHRVAFPVFSPLGRRRGWVLRSYSNAIPKTLTYMDAAEPSISWYLPHPNNLSVWVVEDIPSAVRVAKYRNAVALCGTGCGEEVIAEISKQCRVVTWALDADATESALQLQSRYRLMFERSVVQVLDRDIKDMDEELLESVLGGEDE